jgi:acyl-coenzyme A thioesterase PaaI-like protein
MKLEDDRMCFVCGPENPIGLKLEFWEEGERYHTRFTPDIRHSGYEGMIHGGILTAILDEVMGRLLWIRDLRAATAQMDIRWSRAAHIGETLHVVGWIEEVRGRLVRCAAEARNDAGQIVARSTAKFMRTVHRAAAALDTVQESAVSAQPQGEAPHGGNGKGAESDHCSRPSTNEKRIIG